ncbi:hypothetical protein N9C97_05135 [Candidatus Pelagibacter sp.]|nr:hypothetical protein [Candidatus Pelagibacter sp.]
MIEDLDFETYLYISKDKFQIFVLNKKKLKNLYSQELKIDHQFDFKDLNILLNFLDKNIYKIEKLIGNFIKNIILIVENEKNLKINIGIKKNYETSLKQKSFSSNLTELKDLFKKNYQDQTIMHMCIINYIIDGKRYSSFDTKLINDYFCIEVSFIAIDNKLVFALDNVLEKYQIKIKQYMCGNYINNFTGDTGDEISIIANKLRNGLNINEITIVPKHKENKGFFEKFFQLFS